MTPDPRSGDPLYVDEETSVTEEARPWNDYLRPVVFFVMDRSCEWTRHRLFHCYNGAPRPIQRLWAWAWGPFA